MTKEEIIHKAICERIKLQYPNLLFNTDLSGINLTQGQARKVKKLRSNKGWPDIFIAEPRGWFNVDVDENHKNVRAFLFAGLYLEVKHETPWRKDGTLKKQLVYEYKTIAGKKVAVNSYNHLQMQYDFHKELAKKGYYAVFVWSVDMAMDVIKEYMDLKGVDGLNN